MCACIYTECREDDNARRATLQCNSRAVIALASILLTRSTLPLRRDYATIPVAQNPIVGICARIRGSNRLDRPQTRQGRKIAQSRAESIASEHPETHLTFVQSYEILIS